MGPLACELLPACIASHNCPNTCYIIIMLQLPAQAVHRWEKAAPVCGDRILELGSFSCLSVL